MSFEDSRREFNDRRTVRLTVRQCSELIRSLQFAASIGQTEADAVIDEGARELLLEYVRVIGVNCELLKDALRLAKDETATGNDPAAAASAVPAAVLDAGDLPTGRKNWH